jgi:hypothetical protein
MAKRKMKNVSPSLAIEEMEIKAMLPFQLTLVRMAIIRNTNSNK